MVKQLTEKAQALETTSLQKPALPAPLRAPGRLLATNSHPPLVPDRSLPCPPPPTADDNQWNCQGFRSQYASFLKVARQDTVDIFLLQENIFPERSTTTLPGYRAYHCPRVGRAGGALAILGRHSIACQQKKHSFSCSERVEVQAVTLRLPSLELIIYNIYRPPTADLELEELSGLAAIGWCWRPMILIPTTRGWAHCASLMRQTDNYTRLLIIQSTFTS